MSWGSDTNANKFKKSYIQGFLDISGGNLIVESSSVIQVMSNEYAGQPALLIKPDRFSVFTGQSSYDISYETFAALGFLGTSYEYTTADIYNRIQFIASNTLEGNKTLIGSDASYTDLIVYGNVETRSNGNIIGAKNLLLTGDASLNQKLYVASNVRMDADLSVNQNLYVTGRSQLNNDVSMNRNVDIGTGNNSVAINKDISANIALDVSGATVFRGPVSINQDVSFNQSLKVGTDLSVNRYLYVGNNALFNTDVSINQNLFVSGKATIGRPPTSTAYEFDLSGQQRIYEPTGTRATATAGSLVFEHGDASGVSSIVFLSKNNPGSDYAYIQYEENVGGASEKGVLTIGVENDTGSAGSSDRMSLYAAGGSGFVGVNTKTPIFHLDISGTANVSSTLTTNVIDPSNVASLMTIAQSQIAGNLDIGNNSGRTGPINIGTANTSKTITVGGASSGTTTIQGGTITINPASILELGNNDADVAISIGRDQTTGTLDIGNNTGRTAAINIGTGSSLKTMSIGGAATTLQMYGVDASFAGNVKLGSGNKFVAINKDVSANIALDVSGATVLRGITSTLSDVSINGKLLVSGDVSLNQKLFVNNDVSFNSNLSVGQALTVNNRALFSADVSLNKNTRLGTGINSVAINKDISSQYALDVSGTTSLRGPLYTLSDVSINGKLSVGGDISLNGNISIGTTLQTIGIGLKQPPAPMTANVTNIPGHGSYYAYTSSYGDLNPYFLFDNNDATVYNSVAGYTNPVGDPSLNVWALSDTISDISSTAYPGYRFHIDLPYQINLTSFNYTTSTGRYPVQGTMLGSNDRTSWYNIYSFDLSGTYNNSTLQTGPITFYNNLASNTSLYSKYALVIKSMSCGSFSGTRFALREMELYGNNNILSTQGIGATSIGVSDNLTVGATSNLYGNVTIGSINNVYNRTGAARLLIMEPSGTVASATSGSLVLQHGDASGVSSIVFRSTNDVGSDYAYIQYQENVGGAVQKGLLTIGVENDAGSGTTADRMSLYAAGGSGFIGLNTLDPQYHLDLSGNARISGTVIASLDVSLNRNVDIGSGNNSVSINKDISSNFALDVSGITNLRAPLYTVADVSINGKLFATGDASFNQNLLVGQDLSVNRFLYVNNATLFNGDISTNQNLYVAGKATFGRPPATGGTYELDMSGQMRIYELVGSNVISNTSLATLTLEHADASGASSIMFKSPSTTSNGDYAYIKYQDLSGATTNAGLLTIGIENDPTATTTRDRISLYAAGGSGFIGLNTLDPSFNLDVSGNANVSSSLFVNTINPSSAGSTLNIASTQTNGIINIATEATRTGDINIGNQAATNTIRLGNFDICNNSIRGRSGQSVTVFSSYNLTGGLRIGESMTGGIHQYSFNTTSGSVQIAGYSRGSGNIEIGCGNNSASHTMSIGTGETNAGKLNIANGALSTGSINILDGSGSTGTAIIGRNSAIRIVNSATTTVDVSATGLLTLRGSSLNVIGATLFNSDVSMNQNTRLGAGNNSVAINKDISSQYALDVSGTTNLIGPLYTLGDVSLGQKLFVSGDVSVNTNLYVGGDVSINGNLSVANSVFLLNSDISTNQNLYVAGRATFGSPPISGTTYELDVSGQMRIYEQTGSNVTSNTSVATLTLEHADASGASSIMFKSPSTASNGDYAYIKYQDLSGATTNAGLLTIGIENDPTATNADKISLYAAGGSGYVGVNTLNPGYNLDVSGNVNVSSTFYTNTIESLTSSSTLTIAGTDRTGTINIGHSGSSARIISIGSSDARLFLGGSQIRLRDTGNGSVSFGRISSDTTQDSTGVTLLSGVNTTGSVRIMDGSGSTGTTTIGRNNAIQIVNSATTTVDVSATGLLTLRGSSLNVVGATRFNSDVSFNQNAKLGAGTNAIAINKDISSNFALDISGATNFRGVISTLSDISVNGRLFTSGDVSLNQKLFVNGDASFNADILVGQDLSVNRFLYAANNALFNTDVSINQNLYVSGRTAIGRPPTNTTYELDVSGQMRIYETVGTSASGNNGSLTLEHGDASGVSSIVFRSKNNNASDYGYLQYQENVGGSSEKGLLTLGIENDAAGGASDRISLYAAGGIGFVGVNTKDPSYHLDVSGNMRVTGNTILTFDVSMNRNAQIGAGSNSVSINKDISSQYALDISGATNFRGIINTLSDISVNGRLFTSGDVSLNQKLFVRNDISTNSNVYVGNTVFTNKMDTTVNSANIDIGATQSSGRINIGGLNGRTGNINIGTNTNTGSAFTIQLGHDTGVGPNINIGLWNYNGSNGVLQYANNGQFGAVGDLNLFSGATSTLNLGSTMTGGIINVGPNIATASSTELNIATGSALTGNINLGRGPAIKIANGTSTNIDISASGTLALRGTTVTAPTTALDNSSNQVATTAFVKNNISNLVAGAGAALDTLYELSNAINNDASFGYNIVTSIGLRAYDTSVVHITGTESIAGNKTFTNDTVIGGNLTTVQKGVFGYGTAPVGTPYEFDMSGQMRIYELVGSNVISNTSLATLTLEHADASGASSIMFKSPSTTSNGDYAYIKYQDLSGATTNNGLLTIGVENDPTVATTADKISLFAAGGTGYVGVNTRNPTFNLDVSGGFRTNGDASINVFEFTKNSSQSPILKVNTVEAIQLSGGSELRFAQTTTSGTITIAGTQSSGNLSIGGSTVGRTGIIKIGGPANKNTIGNVTITGSSFDSSNNLLQFIPDVSFGKNMFVFGDVSLNNKLFVNSDASLNQNLYVGQDVSINRNLYVANQTVLTNDVSMNRNVDIGTGNNSVSINKDISSQYALDISGETNMRGNLTTFGNIAITGGNIIVDGTPISTAGTGTSLTTQGVKVGTYTNYYVTVDKANFYNDPSLVIYYNFDTSVNGYKIENMAASGSTYDGSFNVTGTSTTTGMIDTTTKKFGAASLKNNPVSPISNAGVYVPNASSIPISTTMTFSMWVNKLGTPVAGQLDRIFEYSSGATVDENNSIALDISSSGVIIPILTNGITPCLGTLTSPILSYNICDGSWNHIVWTITPSTSYIYINGAIKHYDSITTAVPTTSRSSAYIAFTQFGAGTRDFSGNIDDYRYYSGKALNQAEIYQLYNNTFFNLDICGGLIANGSSIIYEPSGSRATANSGTLTLIHGDASGASSIMFKSVNDPLEYGYIQYEENSAGSTGYHYGLMTIGIENDAGTPAAYTTQADRVSLYPSGGQGFVGVNTKTPQYSLDVSGTMRILEGAGTSAAPTAGSLILEHTAVGGTSSIMFKGPNTTTSDYAYVQYTDASSVVQSLLKYDLSSGTDGAAVGNTTFTSTGTNSATLATQPTDNSFAWVAGTPINGITPVVCISFNQTNLNLTNTTSRINYLQVGSPSNMSSFTFSVWIRPGQIAASDNSATPLAWMIANLSNSSSNGSIDIWLENNGRIYVLLGDDNNNYIRTNSTLVVGTWYHLVFTFDGNLRNGFLYLNGVLDNQVQGTTGLSNKTLKQNNALLVGLKWSWNTGTGSSDTYGAGTTKFKGFRGQMAFMNVFDVGISASDVLYLYNNPAYNVATNPERGMLTIGVENDTGVINNDRIVLWPGAGTGNIGINTKTPSTTLDISGTVRIYEGAGTTASTTAGSLILEHTAVGGTSSIMFKGPNTTTSDYAYVQYTDDSSVVQSLLKYDLSINSPTTLTGLATLASTGTSNTNTTFWPTDNSFAWFSNTESINNVVTPAFCLSFNQVNVTTGGTAISPLRMNYLETSYTMGSAADITFSAWIRPSGIDINQSTPGRIYILYAANGGTSGTGVIDMYIEINSNTNKGKLYCLINADGTNYQLTNVAINQNAWNHVALSFSSTNKNGQLYLNNVPATNELTGFNGKVLNYLDKFWIGVNYNGTTASSIYKAFRGRMAFINIFDKALPASDIAYLYNNPAYNVATNPERGLLTIGVENDTGTINNDRIVLWPGAGTGYVGINTRTPTATLDVSGTVQAVSYNATSDYRLKENVSPLDSLFNVDKLSPVTYTLKGSGKQDIGFIAHEVQELYPFLVNGVKDGPNTQSINYNGFIGILTKEIKDLKAKVQEQEERIIKQETRLEAMEKLLLNK